MEMDKVVSLNLLLFFIILIYSANWGAYSNRMAFCIIFKDVELCFLFKRIIVPFLNKISIRRVKHSEMIKYIFLRSFECTTVKPPKKRTQ